MCALRSFLFGHDPPPSSVHSHGKQLQKLLGQFELGRSRLISIRSISNDSVLRFFSDRVSSQIHHCAHGACICPSRSTQTCPRVPPAFGACSARQVCYRWKGNRRKRGRASISRWLLTSIGTAIFPTSISAAHSIILQRAKEKYAEAKTRVISNPRGPTLRSIKCSIECGHFTVLTCCCARLFGH
jgi:hypothetical protein